jgi:hypothetical protein
MLLDRYLLCAVAKPYGAIALPLVALGPWLLTAHRADVLVSATPILAWFAGSFAFSRLVRDGEIGALRASGCTLSRILAGPLFLATLLASAAAGVASLFGLLHGPWILRSTHALASVLILATLLPLSVRFAKGDAYLPSGFGVLLLGFFEGLIAIAWITASGPLIGTARVAALDLAAIGSVIYFVRWSERW